MVQSDVQTAVGAAADLTLATTAAATVIGADEFGAFQFGANTYVIAQDENPAVEETDMLIRLTGPSNLTDEDFILV